MNTAARGLPIPLAHLHGLIEQALIDLRQARRVDDVSSAARCERRMNALLDQLAKHLERTAANTENKVCAYTATADVDHVGVWRR